MRSTDLRATRAHVENTGTQASRQLRPLQFKNQYNKQDFLAAGAVAICQQGILRGSPKSRPWTNRHLLAQTYANIESASEIVLSTMPN